MKFWKIFHGENFVRVCTKNVETPCTLEYLEKVHYVVSDTEHFFIFDMDETPIYIDMIGTRTISFKDEKNTEAKTTGKEKITNQKNIPMSNIEMRNKEIF